MIEPTENPSLFNEDEIAPKLSKPASRRKAASRTEDADSEAPAPKAAKAARAPKTPRAPKTSKTSEAPKPAKEAKTPKAPKAAAASRKRTAAKPRAEAAEKAPAPALLPPGPRPEAEEWKPGGSEPQAKAAPAPAPAQPAPAPAPAPAEPAQPPAAASEAPQASSTPPPNSSRPFAYEHRTQGRPAASGQSAQPQEYREHREQRGFRRDRDFRGRRDFRDRREPPRESVESREQRIAAARQEFTSQASQGTQGAQGAQAEPGAEVPRPEPVFAEGIVEVSGKGFGFLRDAKRNFSQHPNDVFVTPEVCRRYTLRDGMWIRGEIRRGNRGSQLYRLTSIEGEDPEKFRVIPLFEELTTINPNRFVKLETVPERYTTRVIDLMAPIGRGQRGLIVAPPRTGKTTLLQHIAEAIIANHQEMKLLILLVDERPEEVTEIRRSVPGAEIMASSNDMDLKSHTRIAQLAIERAKRLVEMGKHVFVLLDSITRVGRAFNNAMSGGGRTMSGGVDARALEIPRKLFAAARNTEEAGSLTIIATALIETGSRMDDLIFQEFKGTGNMELVLDRKVSDLRIYPAVDIFQSGTRREELLLPEADLHKINLIRRGLAGHKAAEAIERLLSFLRRFPTNAQMLREIPG